MNRTFKVAKSLTRGGVVTSEKASSYQGKAVKTVIATAVAALVAGTAVAAETAADETPTPTYGWTTQEGITNATISTEVKIADGNKLVSSGDALTIADGAKVVLTSGQHIGVKADDAETAKGVISVAGGEVSLDSSGLHANDFTQSGGTITVGNKSAANVWANHANVGGYYTYTMTGGTMNVNEGGRLWIGSGDGDTPATMKFQGGTLNLKGTETNYAIVSTMTLGTFSNANGEEYAQPLSFEGTNVNVDGSALLMSRDIQIGGGVIKVNDDAHLYLLAEKQLSSDGKVLTSATSDTWSKGSVTVTGGEITVAEKGTLSVAHNDLVLKGGTISNAGTFSAPTLTVKSGTMNNTGTLDVDTLTIQGGTVNTVFQPYETPVNFTAQTVNLEGGVLNLAALNSKSSSSSKENDRLLLNYGTWNLAGGELRVAGTKYEGDLKIGRKDAQADVTVTSDYSFNKVEFGSSKTVANNTPSTLTIGSAEKNGKLTIADLNLSNGDVTVKGGSTLNITDISAIGANAKLTNAGTVNITGTVKTTQTALTDANFVNTGSIYTGLENLVALTYNSDKTEISTATITAFGSALNGTGDSGNVFDTADRTLKLDEYNKIAAAMGKLTMLNTVVTSNTAGEDLKFSDVASSGLKSPATTVTAAATDKAVTLTPTAAVLVANVKTDAETVTIDGSSAGVTLAGNDGVLFGTGVKTVTVKGTNGLTLGYEAAEKTGSIAGEVTVETGSKLAVEAGSFTITGIANAGTLAIDGGDLTTSYLTGSATITDGILAVLGNKAATTATGKATPAADSVDPFANAVKVDQITFNGSATDKDTGILAVGANAQAAEVAVSSVYDAHELAGKNIVYLTKQAKFSAEPAQATDYLIDVAQVAASEGFTAEAGVLGNTLTSQTLKAIKLTNVTAAALEGEAGQKTLRVAQTGSTATAKVDFGNWFYGEKDYESTVTNGLVDGVITFSPNKDKIKQIEKLNVAALAKDAADNVTFGQNEIVDELAFKTVAYNEAVTDRADELGLTGEEHSKYIASAMETYFDQLDIASELAIAGGVFGTTLDINDQVTAALDRRTSLANLNAPRTEGFTPWVDVFGTKNEAKRIYGEGAGYEADIYGAVLGFDYTAACGGVLGLAFNVGQADGNSVGIGSAKVENDADFYGVSLYAAQTFGDFNVKADLGYTQVKNDLKMNGVTKTWKESQDADVITFGVGTEYLVKAGALNVVPHAGIRMTRIDLDDSKYGAEYETMTVYQMPLGVAFSGTFDTNGWKVAPMVDLSVVPTFGDKDAEAKYFGGVKDVVRAVDSNPIRATLGVEAQTGAWTFGVNYGLTAGSDDRLNNSLNANARYTF
jgi:putative uncharacterized protein (fragment)